jgi:hypothetical protein
MWVGHSCPTPLTLILILQVPAQSFAIPWKSGASAPRKTLTNEPRLQPLRYHRQLCHPERSMRIRLMNPHAQSKDPCTAARASTASGSSPGIAGSGGVEEIPNGTRPWNPTFKERRVGLSVSEIFPPPSRGPEALRDDQDLMSITLSVRAIG